MANSVYITNASLLSLLNSLATLVDSGSAAVIEIYDGSVPADADAAEGNVLLASLTMSATAFGGGATDSNPGGLLTADTIASDSSADATGTATHFRIKTQTGGTVRFQGTVGTATSTLVLNTTSIVSGATVSITALTIAHAEGP